MLDASGRATTLHEVFGGRIALLAFIYASCPDPNGCPLSTAVLHRVQRRLGADPARADGVRLVSLSFDPARDTPEAMRRYGAPFSAATPAWRFLTTASSDALDPILRGYGQGLLRTAEGDLSHLLRVFLVDAAGRVRNVYTVAYLHADTLVNDVETLLLEDARPPRTASVATPSVASGPGDDRRGYERRDYRSRSVGIDARRGVAADLAARARTAPLGLPPVPVPADNPLSADKVALGRKLFYDRRLSLNGTFSCAMCHIPEQGFTHNELATAVGIEGRTVRRNAPTIYNVAYASRLFVDGRETRLEHQVWGPLLASNEMGNPSIGALLEKVASLEDYAGRFEAAFPGRGLGMETLGMALASYERTLVSGGSPFDRWRYGGDEAALSPAARRGFAVFEGKGGCASCHTVGDAHALFSDGAFHNTGVGYRATTRRASRTQPLQVSPGVVIEVDTRVVAQVSEPRPEDLGRYEVTQDPVDRWRYRTPSLRNVALTAPYMHDGSLATLADVVSFYDAGGVPNEALDPRIRPLGLSAGERDDLVAFLASLTGGDVDVLVADGWAAPIGDPGDPGAAR